MQDAGIHDGDLLVVDRSIDAEVGMVVVVVVGGEFTVKRLATGGSDRRDGSGERPWFSPPSIRPTGPFQSAPTPRFGSGAWSRR